MSALPKMRAPAPTPGLRVKQRIEPLPGQQSLAVSCPSRDLLYGGARGGAKTWFLLLDWLEHKRTWGGGAKGMLFRRSYPELAEIMRRCHKIFPSTGGVWRASEKTWIWVADGSFLCLRHIENVADAEIHQGQEYTWIGGDEIGNYPSPEPIDLLRASMRSGDGVRSMMRFTANPGGPGHNWLKERYVDPSPPMKIFDGIIEFDDGTKLNVERCFIPATLDDNPALLEADPEYWANVVAAAAGNMALLRAWRYGDWDIVAGGMFDDVWLRSAHVIKPFPIPASWFVDRSFDWGSSKPFSVGWWAESDGTAPAGVPQYPRGTVIRIAEWYGRQKSRANVGLRLSTPEIAKGIRTREEKLGLKVMPGPADGSIFNADRGVSIGDEFKQKGVKWLEADKRPGSRKTGWERARRMLKAVKDAYVDKVPMEEPGLLVFDNCVDFIRTVPILPRDKTKTDDVDTDAEDHIADEVRYRLMQARRQRMGKQW